jgi:hypothetical protein
MLVCRVVIEDDVDDLAGRDVGFDRIEEANELLMALPLHATADDLVVFALLRDKEIGEFDPEHLLGAAISAVYFSEVLAKPGSGGSRYGRLRVGSAGDRL